MKKIFGWLFILVLFFGNTSCQKEFLSEDLDPSSIPGAKGSFTAKIDGNNFTADNFTGAFISSGIISISGISKTGENITLKVADSGMHLYLLNIESENNVGVYSKGTEYAYTTNQGNVPAQSGGTFSITEINTRKKTISGTFTMNVYRQIDGKQKKITEGRFIEIPYQTTPFDKASVTDTFRVKVNDIDFFVYSIIGIKMDNMISVVSKDKTESQTVGVTFPADINPGTYDFGLFGSDYIGQYNPSITTYLAAHSGKLTIFEHNKTTKRIRGNFYFEAKEIQGTSQASLTAGYFSVIYR
ncbi:MAG: DUF6252 family protein [Ginsengibacter sp.]